MKLAVIGTGYVGLVSGACFAELGYHVTCVDHDKSKVDALKQGIIPIYEPDLDALVAANVAHQRLSFTDGLQDAIAGAEIVLLAVGTPTGPEDGSADLTYIFEAARQIAPLLEDGAVVVTKSTVPVGTASKIRKAVYEARGNDNVYVASNPEFLREGCAIRDFLEPDRIIVGTRSTEAEEKLRQLYQPLTAKSIPLLCTNTQTAELIKYAANGFLATKIAFINEMADLCEKTGADVEILAEGMGLDPRIGHTYLKPGPGFGGSCFPKDTRALEYIAKEHGTPNRLIPAVIESNEVRKSAMADKIIAACGGNVAGKQVAILGLTFKANTDDMRESASLVIIPELLEAGASLKLFDPEGMEQAKKQLTDHTNLSWCNSYKKALDAADAAVIVTEWPTFSTINWSEAKTLMNAPVLIDLRNLYGLEEMKQQGITYHSLGRT